MELGLLSPIASASLKAVMLFGFQFRAIYFKGVFFFFKFSLCLPWIRNQERKSGFIKIWLGYFHLELMQIVVADLGKLGLRNKLRPCMTPHKEQASQSA